MNSYFRFVSSQWAILLFGFLAVFGGNFGQSFFVGLFGEGIQTTLGLSASSYSLAYSLATLASAITVIWLGGFIDHVPLSRYTTAVCIGLAAAGLMLWQAQNFWMLMLGFFLLRLFGQALLPHAGSTTMARVFVAERGKALSISASAFPVGEIVLPSIAAVLIITIGWQNTYLVVAIVVLGFFLPMLLWLIRYSGVEPTKIRHPSPGNELNENSGENSKKIVQKNTARRALLKDYRYWLALPGLMAGPFVATGIFIHQQSIIDSKGWTLAWFGLCYVVFGIVHWVSSMVSGILVDRFTAIRLLPYFLIPLALSLLALVFVSGPLSAVLMMVLLALSIGGSPPITGSLWPEIYGADNIGAIRSINIAIIVFSTSLSPILYGVLIDLGVSLSAMMLATALYVIVAIVLMRMSYPANPHRHEMAHRNNT